MKETNKKIILILSVFTIFLLSLSIVSATDNSTSNNTNQSQSTAVDNTNQNILEQSSNNTNLKGDVHVTNNNVSNLRDIIDSSNNTVIFLDNQTFDITDDIYIYNKNLTFYGGHSFGDGQTSTIIDTDNSHAHRSFVPMSSNITFIGFNFDSNDTDISSYDSSRLSIINCTFNNLSDGIYIQSDSANRYSLITDNCTFKNSYITLSYNASALINNSKFDNTSIEVRYKNHYLNITNSEFCNNEIYPIDIESSDCKNVTCYIDKCKFYNNKQSSIYSTLSNATVNITNSIFNNNYHNNGGAIFIPEGKLYLENTTFINNTAKEFGGAIYTTNGIMVIDNCSFNNNSALYGGAIYTKFFEDKNLIINNSKFDGNTAIIAGGAISFKGNNTLINNSVFNNNNANVCGGAIVIGNSSQNTISNSNFTNNNASGYGDDIYYYYGNISLDNNKISNIYNGKNNSIPIYGQNTSEGFVIHLNNNTTGFCLEIDLPYPSYNIGEVFSQFNNTNLVINTLNYEKVGDYVKYMIYNYYGKVPNKALNIAIWTLTNYNYTDSDYINDEQKYMYIDLDALNSKVWGSVLGISRYALNLLGDPYENYTIAKDIVIDTINAYNQGVRIPDHFVTVNEDGSETLYDFGSIFSNVYQNFITFKTTTIIYDMNITKITNTPVVYKGEDTSFDIIVSNNGTMTLYNVSIIEDSYDDLTYKSWKAVTGNWTYSFVNNRHTWTLNNPLLVNQSARITVIFSTNNSTVGDKINTVIATSNNTDNKTANNTTKVIENNTTNPNNPENNTPNKPTPASPDNHSNITPKEAVKTTPDTGYPIVVLIIALIAILASGVRKK